MKTNALMRSRLAESKGPSAPLQPRLAELAAGPLSERGGALVLEALVAPGLGDPKSHDLTGFEALTNKIHLEDHVDAGCRGDAMLQQGIRYAEALVARLSRKKGAFRVVLSRDPDLDDVTVRFFTRRPEQPWGSDDPEEFEMEEIAQWDV